MQPLARPAEFAELPQAKSANLCWRNWASPTITPNDGLVRANHPLIEAVLGRLQSASSLRLLLRDPIGFVWKYGLGLKAPELEEEPLVLDAAAFGTLVHDHLERVVRHIEADGGLATASASVIQSALREVSAAVQADWERERPVPPRVIWEWTLEDGQTRTS